MTALAAVFVALCAIALMMAPRRWAALPLLLGGVLLPVGIALEVGPFNFYPLRSLLVVAMLRVLMRGERLPGPLGRLDKAVLWWAGAAVLTSLFHPDPAAALVNRLGLVFTACGVYFVLRALCSSVDDVYDLCGMAAMIMVPLALAMLFERSSGSNPFALFGGVDSLSEVRNGAVRAQGPFAHSILAGSIAATTLPIAAALWSSRRKTAVAGMASCLVIVAASGSSGPIMSMAFALIALCLWPWRRHMQALRWTAVGAYVVLELMMNAPAYYVITRIDFTGSSTSWHRAALIEAAIDNWADWWAVGTAYTRHWLPYGVPWSADHIDVTNYYLRMGVDGGLPLMLLFILVLARGFSLVGRSWRHAQDAASPSAFLPWALGASLFAHAATFVSVSYFDQSVVFLYLVLAAIGSIAPAELRQSAVDEIPDPQHDPNAYPSKAT